MKWQLFVYWRQFHCTVDLETR